MLPPLKTPKKEKSDVMEEYNKLVQEAKQLIGEGKVKAALDLNRQALKICHSDKLAKKIAKMEVTTYLYVRRGFLFFIILLIFDQSRIL